MNTWVAARLLVRLYPNPVHLPTLIKNSGLGESLICKTLRELENEGFVYRPSSDIYSLTSKGVALIQEAISRSEKDKGVEPYRTPTPIQTQVMSELYKGPATFEKLKKAFPGYSRNLLALVLNDLVGDAMVRWNQTEATYELTKRGETVVYDAMKKTRVA